MAKSTAKRAPKKGSTARKVFAFILIIILIGALATSITFNVLMYQKMTSAPSNPELPGINDPDKDHVVITPDPAISMLSISPDAAIAASDVVSVPVTVTPDRDVETILDWSVSFKNPTAEWATGKTVTNYVTVTSTGERTATVNVLQAFGEKIIVTASLRDNHDINTTCTVDYAIKYTFEGWKGGLKSGVVSYYAINEAYFIMPKLSKSIGTVDDKINHNISLSYSTQYMGFYESMSKQLEFIDNSVIESLEYFKYSEMEDQSYGEEICACPTVPLVVNSRGELSVDFLPSSTVFEDENQLVHGLLHFFGIGQPINKEYQSYVDSLYNLLDKNQVINIERIINDHTKNYLAGSMDKYQKIHIDNAFKLKYSLEGAYNSFELIFDIPMNFIAFPLSASNLTINPPSIIV